MTNTQSYPTVRYPSPATLKKYGLALADWVALLLDQGGVCPICGNIPSSGRFVTDHEHVKGFKKMKPEQKRKYIRGICCQHCNRYYLARGISVEKAQNLVKYLQDYQSRTTK